MNAADAPAEIRAARAQDAAALAGLLDELGFPTSVDVVALRLDTLDRAGETVLIAVRDTEVLGFVSVHVTPVLHRPTPVGRMTALVVTSQERGSGIGRALVAAAERHLADAGCALIEVTSRHDHTGAHAFYQRLGYAITSHRFGKTLTPGLSDTGPPPAARGAGFGREIRTWSVAEDGSKTPLPGTGLRVPLQSGPWVAIDFHYQGPRGPIVDLAVRSEDIGRRPLPSLAVVPCAGNHAWVVIGRGSPGDDRSLGVVVVDAAELGDHTDGWLRRTTSGDPLGEVVLARPDVQPVSARRFVLDYGAIASVQLSVRASTEALLMVEVLDRLQQVPPPASEFPSLDMSVRFGGSNAVSFWFEEVIGEIIEEPDA